MPRRRRLTLQGDRQRRRNPPLQRDNPPRNQEQGDAVQELEQLRHELERPQPVHPQAREVVHPMAEQVELPPQLPPQHRLGLMNNSCNRCQAKYFREERNTKGVYTKCCFEGKVYLPPVALSADNIVDLFIGESASSRHFLQNIRHYNCALAMASWNAPIDQHPGRGPKVITIHGQAYHLTSAGEPLPGERPQYAQLYILDTDQALQERLADPRNVNLRPDILEQLQRELVAVNPFVRRYQNIAEIIQQQRALAAANNQPVRPVRMIIAHRALQDRRYDAPMTAEIAAIYVGDEGAPPNPAERQLETYPNNQRNTVKIRATSPTADPMTYPLLFFHGETGWHTEIPRNPAPGQQQLRRARPVHARERISLNEFYAFRVAVRDAFSTIHRSRLLFQQYLVDAFTKIEGNELEFIRRNQAQLRVESYQGLMDHIHARAEEQHANVGRIVILPSTFHGSDRNMYQNYQDAMSIVVKYGKPDIFLTMTANPRWPEVTENLLPHQEPSDRPDIISRVFHLKLQELLDDILKRHLLGHVKAHVYTIEFQKRGLPHVHMLIFLSNPDKPQDADDIDHLVSAEIPDPQANEGLHNMVKKHMIHGPCGDLDPHCPCMAQGKCTRKFPKPLKQRTEFNVDGYPQYRRRGQHAAQLRHHLANDSWVVPHNPHLLMKFNCHINVEVCTSVKSVKYIFKYIHKGGDCAHVEIRENTVHHDEILQYLNARYVGPHQAVFRIMQYKFHDRSHTIIRLAVHLPLQQNVYFQEGREQQVLHRNPNTTLTAWFELNDHDQHAHQYLYHEIPEHYTFDKGTKTWKRKVSLSFLLL